MDELQKIYNFNSNPHMKKIAKDALNILVLIAIYNEDFPYENDLRNMEQVLHNIKI